MCSPESNIKFCTCNNIDNQALETTNYWIYKRKTTTPEPLISTTIEPLVIGEFMTPPWDIDSYYSSLEVMLANKILKALLSESLLDINLPPNEGDIIEVYINDPSSLYTLGIQSSINVSKKQKEDTPNLTFNYDESGWNISIESSTYNDPFYSSGFRMARLATGIVDSEHGMQLRSESLGWDEL